MHKCDDVQIQYNTYTLDSTLPVRSMIGNVISVACSAHFDDTVPEQKLSARKPPELLLTSFPKSFPLWKPTTKCQLQNVNCKMDVSSLFAANGCICTVCVGVKDTPNHPDNETRYK